MFNCLGYINKYAGSGTRIDSLFLKATASSRSTAWVTPANCKNRMVEGFDLHSTQG